MEHFCQRIIRRRRRRRGKQWEWAVAGKETLQRDKSTENRGRTHTTLKSGPVESRPKSGLGGRYIQTPPPRFLVFPLKEQINQHWMLRSEWKIHQQALLPLAQHCAAISFHFIGDSVTASAACYCFSFPSQWFIVSQLCGLCVLCTWSINNFNFFSFRWLKTRGACLKSFITFMLLLPCASPNHWNYTNLHAKPQLTRIMSQRALFPFFACSLSIKSICSCHSSTRPFRWVPLPVTSNTHNKSANRFLSRPLATTTTTTINTSEGRLLC